MSDEKPSHFGVGGPLKVSCQAATAPEPGKGPFDNPASRQELEAFDPVGPLDDLDVPRPAAGECINELLAAIHPVGKDVPESWKMISQSLQQRDGAVDILNVGGMNVDSQKKTIGVSDDVPL